MTTHNELNESQQILSSVTRTLKRRRTLMAVTLVGVLIPILIYDFSVTPVYEAGASLVFEEIPSGLPEADPTKTPPQQYLFNRLEEITSQAFAVDVAAALAEPLKARFEVPGNVAPGDREKYISGVIHESITAYPLRNSNIFRIRVQMEDPKLCAAVANTAAKILQDREYRIHQRGVTALRGFVNQQLTSFNSRLRESEDALRTYKESQSITSLESESIEVLRKMTEAEVLYNANRADRGAAEKKLSTVNATLASARRDLVPALTDISGPSAQRLKDRLVELQARYAQLLVQAYPTGHPEMVNLRQEIDQTKKALTEEATKFATNAGGGDPIAQMERYVDESVALQIEIASLTAREEALRRTVDGYRAYLRHLPGKEFELARLVRERDVNQKLYAALLEKREEVRIAEAKQIPNSRVIDQAEIPRRPIKPRRVLNLLLGTVFALLLATGIGIVVESGAKELDSTLDFESQTGWPVLALVPEMKRDGSRLRLWHGAGTENFVRNALTFQLRPHSAQGESYLMLRTRLELLGVGDKYRTLLVTSGAPGEGKSTTLANLAAAFAAAGRSTIVVDAELRRPVMHDIFGIPKAPGLSDLLVSRNGRKAGRDAKATEDGESPQPRPGDVQRSAVSPASVPELRVLACGERVRSPHWEISRAAMSAVLEDLKKQYEVILVDSASPALVHATMMLSGIVDAVLVVVESGTYEAQRVMEIRRLLEPAGANVVGAVVTKVDSTSRYGSYYGAYYGHES